MQCPYCAHGDSKVIESRTTADAVRRRRECLACGRRFTTYERVEVSPLQVIKKDGMRETFSREKLRRGLLKACEKRPITSETIDAMVDRVERDLRQAFEREVTTNQIGERVMAVLREVDQVAYVRFASVYREFKDVETFLREILPLLDKERGQGL
ncbi:transcriptional repressor NrdR [Kyrpidia spormannii]|uniref:Transcriptional repressor NrdR n=3 Tax=Kyrpidia TaxID=1129704 RepID=A0A2K8N5U6_9BACL|nr:MULTISPECIES: transcriptional regulator NrdR [Kyrpidia]HHY65814.1 transcriptional repressor NrdR [Alicyclobacillus sp.]ADG05215.1 ATP-cone domain protein [Kyrpidia tusciae DSM 2912]ATY84177.1 transcriptional repressor NrdR [Kyrpidia spormannii]MCL6576990.1 transcriptional regulator NrdR [Kyrpidia sp.]CAB3390452.1 negative regulator of transcription of ribonucleotide reductase nrd genes and operons [Kyrpidia spormannii]